MNVSNTECGNWYTRLLAWQRHYNTARTDDRVITIFSLLVIFKHLTITCFSICFVSAKVRQIKGLDQLIFETVDLLFMVSINVLFCPSCIIVKRPSMEPSQSSSSDSRPLRHKNLKPLTDNVEWFLSMLSFDKKGKLIASGSNCCGYINA